LACQNDDCGESRNRCATFPRQARVCSQHRSWLFQMYVRCMHCCSGCAQTWAWLRGKHTDDVAGMGRRMSMTDTICGACCCAAACWTAWDPWTVRLYFVRNLFGTPDWPFGAWGAGLRCGATVQRQVESVTALRTLLHLSREHQSHRRVQSLQMLNASTCL
jgi:hypothetical protein